jgi:hypothetical protein
MQQIKQYKLPVADEQKFELPFPGALMAPDVIDGEIIFWYVAAEDVDETRTFIFYCISTEQDIPDTFAGQYWATVQIPIYDAGVRITEIKEIGKQTVHIFIRPPKKKRAPIVATPTGDKNGQGHKGKSTEKRATEDDSVAPDGDRDQAGASGQGNGPDADDAPDDTQGGA